MGSSGEHRRTGMVKSGMSVQEQSTGGRDSRIRAKRWRGRVDHGIYQITEFSDKRLRKTGVRLSARSVSLDAATVSIHTGWYVSITQEVET
jgi:hypothetical protein